MKAKVIWSYKTAAEVAAAKHAAHGTPFTVIAAEGGGFHVVPAEKGN